MARVEESADVILSRDTTRRDMRRGECFGCGGPDPRYAGVLNDIDDPELEVRVLEWQRMPLCDTCIARGIGEMKLSIMRSV